MQSLPPELGRKGSLSLDLYDTLGFSLSTLFKISALPIDPPYPPPPFNFIFKIFLHSICHHINIIYIINIVCCLTCPLPRVKLSLRLP